MLFSIRADDFESEKERNFYYKFYAGYFFNELIPNVETHLSSFCTLLNNCTRGGKSASLIRINLTPNNTHISFDNHGYLFSNIKLIEGNLLIY
jgi:hypothetical protein